MQHKTSVSTQTCVPAVVSLCKKLKDQALLLASPKQAIAPLMAAIQRLEASPEYITPIHVFVLQL